MTEREVGDGRATRQGRHVTLVHGTFASRSKWPLAGSPLSQALVDEGATCHPFQWSGGNSHRARMRAAEELSDHLRKIQESTGGAPQAVVAHSHGGNVALHAVWRLGALGADRVKVVTLATPYLFAVRKTAMAVVDTVVAFCFGLLLSLTLLLIEVLGSDGEWGSAWLEALVKIMAVAVGVQSIGLIYFWVSHGLVRPPSRASVIARVQTPNLPPGEQLEDLLVVRAAHDEAGGVLGTAQLSGWVALTAARVKPGLIVVVTYFAGLGTVNALDPAPEGESSGPLMDAFLNVASPIWMVLLIVVLAVPLTSLAYGWDGPTTSMFAVVTAEASPPGDCIVWQREMRDVRAGGLSHSSLYDDPDVIGRIVAHTALADPTIRSSQVVRPS